MHIDKVTCMEMSTPSGPKHHMECDCMRHWRVGNCHHIVAAMAKSNRFPQFNNLTALLEPMEDRARPGPKRKRGNELRAKDPDSPGQVDTVDVYATAKRANVDTKGSRRKLLERIGAQTVRNYMREQRAAASSSASASSSGAGTGAGRGVPPPPLPVETLPPPPPLPVETKPQGNILNAEGQAQAECMSALLGGGDNDGTTFV